MLVLLLVLVLFLIGGVIIGWLVILFLFVPTSKSINIARLTSSNSDIPVDNIIFLL